MLAVQSLPLGSRAARNLIGEIGFVAASALYAATGLLPVLLVALPRLEHLCHVHAPANVG